MREALFFKYSMVSSRAFFSHQLCEFVDLITLCKIVVNHTKDKNWNSISNIKHNAVFLRKVLSKNCIKIIVKVIKYIFLGYYRLGKIVFEYYNIKQHIEDELNVRAKIFIRLPFKTSTLYNCNGIALFGRMDFFTKNRFFMNNYLKVENNLESHIYSKFTYSNLVNYKKAKL